MQRLLRFFGIKNNQDKIEPQEFYAEDKIKLENGEEIQPPWIFAPHIEPWSGTWKQGSGEVWLLEIWLPFWNKLDNNQRQNYLERWNPPTEDWREYVTVHWIIEK